MIQAIIFDLDGTLYSKQTHLLEQIDIATYSFLKENAKLTLNQIKKLEDMYPNILDALHFLGIQRKSFYNVVYKNIKYSELTPNLPLKHLLQKLQTKIFVVSLSPKQHITKILKKLTIISFITEIYAGDHVLNTDKKSTYISIFKKYNLNPSNIVVVGDNYELDLLEAQKMGCKTIEINNTRNLIEALTILDTFSLEQE